MIGDSGIDTQLAGILSYPIPTSFRPLMLCFYLVVLFGCNTGLYPSAYLHYLFKFSGRFTSKGLHCCCIIIAILVFLYAFLSVNCVSHASGGRQHLSTAALSICSH